MRTSILASVACALWCAPAARASVIYDFNPGTTLTPSGASTTPLSFVLVLDDNFAPGSFSRSCNQGCYAQTGSFADFQLFAYDGSSLVGELDNTPDTAFEMTSGTLAANSSEITWNTSTSNFKLDFGDGDWSATFNSDVPSIEGPCYGGSCTATGTISVGEPDMTAILFVMLLGVPLIRLRRTSLRTSPAT